MPFAEAWMELEIIIQSETRRKEEDKYIQNLKHDTN